MRLLHDVDHEALEAITLGMGELMDAEAEGEDSESEAQSYNIETGYESEGSDDEDDPPPEMVDSDSDSDNEEDEDEKEGPITWIRDQFRAYTEGNFPPLEEHEEVAIRLLHLLKKKGASLKTYPELMSWHLKATGFMKEYEQLKHCDAYVSRHVMMKKLKERYNMGNKYPLTKKVKLPVSKTVVKLTLHDPCAVIQALLTDPRLQDDDYFFFNGNPLAPPPARPTNISHQKTADGYRKTYRAYGIDPRKREQLLPLVFYLDGSPVSHFHNMEVTPLKVSLGFFNIKTRTKEYAWRVAGYMEKVHQQGGRARELWTEGGHMEVEDGMVYDEGDSDAESLYGVGKEKKQDFHAMLAAFLEPFGPLFDRGFLWDQPYKGVLYRDIHYHLYISHVRCDNKEAEDICGKYGMRQGKAKQLCRTCHCLLKKADDHLHEVEYKTEPEVKKLVEKEDLKGLQDISQTYLWNAFWDLPFSKSSRRGIHGACPVDMLHTVELGIYKRVRDIFFDRIGKDSKPAKDINALSKEFSRCFARQSDGTIPKTTFSKGIQEGKFMGADYRAILLLILVMVHSEGGRTILKRSRTGNFKEEGQLDDWGMVVELLLLWGAFLRQEEMERKVVRQLGPKNRYMMYLLRLVTPRQKGMGLKLVKFHQILHTDGDIFEHGVPSEYDTHANESHHKPMKKAAKLTQMSHRTFNYQTATRMVDFETIEYALLEIERGLAAWKYYDGLKEEEPMVVEMEEILEEEGEEDQNNERRVGKMEVEVDRKEEESRKLSEGREAESEGGGGEKGGQVLHSEPMDAMMRVYTDEDSGEASFEMISRSKYNNKTKLNTQCVEFLLDLQDELDSACLLPDNYLKIFTRIKRGGQSWRGHPNYRGLGPWRDWAWVDFGQEGQLPCHIWCFVVIPEVKGKRLYFGGIRLQAGVYAVVECTRLVKERVIGRTEMSIIHPIEKLVGENEGEVLVNDDGTVKERKFYLADTDAFTGPCCVVPDIGGPINRYWVIEPRNLWGGYFEDWVCSEMDGDMIIKGDQAGEEEGEDSEIDHDADTDPEESGDEE